MGRTAENKKQVENQMNSSRLEKCGNVPLRSGQKQLWISRSRFVSLVRLCDVGADLVFNFNFNWNNEFLAPQI